MLFRSRIENIIEIGEVEKYLLNELETFEIKGKDEKGGFPAFVNL